MPIGVLEWIFGSGPVEINGRRIDQTTDIPLLVNTHIQEVRRENKQFHTFAPEDGVLWVVACATGMNHTIAGTFYANIQYRDHQLTTPSTLARGANLAADVLSCIKPPMIMVPGETITLFNHNFAAPNLNSFMIKYSEFQLR